MLRQLDAQAHGGRAGPLLVFAGGSNVVVADTLTDLTAVRLANDGITIERNLIRAEGAVWDDVVVTAIEHGLGGLKRLSGIPGLAGATPGRNGGRLLAEVSDTIDPGPAAGSWRAATNVGRSATNCISVTALAF